MAIRHLTEHFKISRIAKFILYTRKFYKMASNKFTTVITYKIGYSLKIEIIKCPLITIQNNLKNQVNLLKNY